MKTRIPYLLLWLLVVGLFYSCKEETPASNDALIYDYQTKATAFLSQYQWDSAYFYYNKAKNETLDKKSEAYAYTLLQLATLQQGNGDLSGCEETITDALANYKGTTYLPYFYNLMAVSYVKQKEYEHALDFYQKAQEATADSLNKAIIQNNIGLIYLLNHSYEQSLSILEPLLTHPQIQGNQLEYARVLDNVGYAQFQLQQPEGIENLNTSLQLRERLQEPSGLLTSYMHLSEYHQTRDAKLAESYASQAYETSKKVNSPDDRLEALKWLTENSSSPLVKDYSKMYFQLNDSLTTARTTAKNQFAKIKYDSKKATLEVIKYKNQNLFLWLLVAFILLVVVLLYFLYQSVTKRKLLQSAYMTETRISKRIHDELANDVFHAMTFTQTKDLQDSSNKEQLLDSLETIYKRSRDISKENSTIRTDDHFAVDLEQMLRSFSDAQTAVIIKSIESIGWNKFSDEKKIAVFRVVQELLINTKKHGKAGVVVVDFQNQSRQLQINYTDNGLGADLSLHNKSGLQNEENRILAMKGTLTFDSQPDKGFRAQLVIPK